MDQLQIFVAAYAAYDDYICLLFHSIAAITRKG